MRPERLEEGWPLLTFETEANGDSGDSWSTFERGPSLVGSLGLSIDFCSALAALVGPEQNIIFLTAHFFTLLVPIAQQSGQAVALGRLSLCFYVRLWKTSQEKDSKNLSAVLFSDNNLFCVFCVQFKNLLVSILSVFA